MSEEKRKKSSKTINFAERKKMMNNSQGSYAKNSSREKNARQNVYYDLNKMREQVNQKIHNKRKSNVFLNSPLWVKFIYAGIILLFVFVLGTKVLSTTGVFHFSFKNNQFISQASELTNEEKLKYDKTIKKKVREVASLGNKAPVVTTEIHKNSDVVLAFGYFQYDNSDAKIYFDIQVVGDTVTSLLINGRQQL